MKKRDVKALFSECVTDFTVGVAGGRGGPDRCRS